MPRTNEFNSTHHEITSRIARLESVQKQILQLLNRILILIGTITPPDNHALL